MSPAAAPTRNGAANRADRCAENHSGQNVNGRATGLHARGAPHLPPWTWKDRCWEPDFRAGDLKLKPLDRVEAKPLVWEGDGRLPRGAVTVIAGEHGAGKSLLAVDWAARITRGEAWSAESAGEAQAKHPNGEPAPSALANGFAAPKQFGEPEALASVSYGAAISPQNPEADASGSPIERNGSPRNNYGEAVIAHAGDMTVELLRLRLDAAGAAPERVASLALAWPEMKQSFSFDTINNRIFGLVSAIRGTNNARLLVIDNLEAWAGNLQSVPCAALVDFLLTRLGELAALAEIAIVVLARLPHSGGQAAARKLDALANQAPVVYLAADDPDRPGRKLLLPVKNTLAPPAPAKAFTIESGRVVWSDEPVAAAADAFIAPVSRRLEARHERESAARWLLAALADGPVASRELFRQARDCGISTKTLRRAAESLGLSPRKASFTGPWQWQLSRASAECGTRSAEQTPSAAEQTASEDGQPRATKTASSKSKGEPEALASVSYGAAISLQNPEADASGSPGEQNGSPVEWSSSPSGAEVGQPRDNRFERNGRFTRRF